MKPEYSDWIRANVTVTLGKCQSVTKAMAEAFPELTRVRGHYHDSLWGERAHWWLTDSEGNIVDPTADQFPSRGRGVYDPWDESQPTPTGKCRNCGGWCFENEPFCTTQCYAEYAHFVTGTSRRRPRSIERE